MGEGVRKPVGGFVFIPAMALIAAWWAYKRGFVRLVDLRVWLACFELLATRCTLERDRPPRFQMSELDRLVGGVGGEHTRRSVRRLETVGLVAWSETHLRMGPMGEGLLVGDPDNLAETIALVTNHRRKVPVPRHVLKFLTRCRRPVVMATVVGHLLRCMYYRKGLCRPLGLCKASFVADVFEVDERNVKGARRLLVSLGILLPGTAPQRCLNRCGRPMCFNMLWEGTSKDGRRRETPPRRPMPTTETPPLRETGNSSSGRSENQKPGAPAPAGVRKRTGRGPRLAKVLDIDLRDPSRVLSLHRQAQRAGLVGDSESELLKVFAVAEHARAHGTRNAPGLFVAVLRRALWHHLTLRDEDQARKALAKVWVAPTRPLKPSAHELRPGKEPPICVRYLIARSLGLTSLKSAATGSNLE